MSSAADKPIFGRLEIAADISSENVIQVSSKNPGENKSIIDHLADDTFALCGPREQAHVMLDKVLGYSDKTTFTCIARLVSDTEKAVEPTPAPAVAQKKTVGGPYNGIDETEALPATEPDGSVLTRRSLRAALGKWTAWGKPPIKLKLLVDELASLEPQGRSVELLVTQGYAAKHPETSVADFVSLLCKWQRKYFDRLAKQGTTQIGKDIARFVVLARLWALSGNLELSAFPWNKLRPSDMAGGPSPAYESFLRQRKQK
ncbi:hypothetical protein CT0861_03592 [Colletotrichum tofieldiae]|uniref:Uncharacterized protein n=1 Tax=Colletotrichum tofieldiae TaxID=708197 RepID=A0A161Y772_9PEZI|nr:hypothetical protein CT0861_03592 [Colletotrichum tofieldiae]GKT89798.1 hypothetical protein Ct61P_07648 [Colletotrichum tofieldiae]